MTCSSRIRTTLLLVALAIMSAPPETAAFSSISTGIGGTMNNRSSRSSVPSTVPVDVAVAAGATTNEEQPKDRPLLRQFGKGINDRVLDSKMGYNWFGSLTDHYTSAETIPCLNMQCSDGNDGNNYNIASRRAIQKAYTESSSSNHTPEDDSEEQQHGRSSGSGCSIVRLRGKDAVSVRGLLDFADNFFEGVDNDDCNEDIKDVGVFRIANNVHAGFDVDVNEEGKMQVLYTKLIPQMNDESIMLPIEVGDLVGQQSLSHAHKGMSTLFDIGSQITSAVLGMTSVSTTKLLDDCIASCKSSSDGQQEKKQSNLMDADNVSNSYQRLIRYLKPQNVTAETDPAFWPHVDSTFLTMIPMPELPGLEVWCPSKRNAESCDLAQRGEWVRPIIPLDDHKSLSSGNVDDDEEEDDCVYVIVLSGEFLQLLSNGQVPTCIHRVIPPSPSSSPADKKYKPRISAPLFVRPRRREEAILDVASDLKKKMKKKIVGSESSSSDSTMLVESEKMGLYFEEGLLEECDKMHIWEYMDCMSPSN